MNLAVLLARAGRSSREAPAVALGPAVLASYGQLAARVAALAGGLRGRFGLAPGERIGLAMSNCPQYLEVLYGCWHAGLVAVPMNAKLHPAELAFMLENSGARLCFASPALAPAINGAIGEQSSRLPALSALIEVGSRDYERLFEAHAIEPLSRAPDDLAWLFYTSGTTGRPKGAMLSHRNLMAMALSYFVDVDQIAPGDSILHAAPMSHGSGLYIVPHVMAAACQVIPESGQFDPAELFALLPAHRGVTCFFAPTMVKRLVSHPAAATADRSNLKTVVYGGGPMYVEDLKQAMGTLDNVFVQIYGQGESPMTITSLTRAQHADHCHPRYEARLGSVGRAQSVVEVRIADPKDRSDDRSLPPGELGEVLVRGDAVMLGYWQNPEASAATLRGGWLHSGDLGVLDEDGFLTLKDRSKDVIISGGSNIYPREIEEVLLGHEGVLECAVIGRSHPDWGEEVMAFVVARPGEQLSPEALDALCLARIARFKRPKVYRFVEALPKNSYGKVLKTALREMAD
ncbi:MAG: long-chain fatty acid--CoA ligase [Kiloniellales bacterium]